MNKLFNKIAALSVGLAMAVGVGVAIKEGLKPFGKAKKVEASVGDVAYTLTCLKNTNNSDFKSYYDVTINSKIWRAPGNQNQTTNFWRIGGKKLTEGADRIITGKSVFDKPIQKITVNHNGVNGSNSHTVVLDSIKVEVSSKSDFSDIVDTRTQTFESNPSAGNFDFVPTSDVWATNSYYKFTISIHTTDNTDKNGGFDLTSIVFYEGSASTEPTIDSIGLTGSPAVSANVNGGSSWAMSAKVNVSNDDGSLDKTVDWTVSPAGAVTFSKTNSDSEEEITVTAVNTANNNVKITATSHDSNFSSVKADSNTFNIAKVYSVDTNTLVTKDGQSSYDAGGAANKVVTFTSTLTYTGDAGEYKVNLSANPSNDVTFSSANPFTSSASGADFTATFTKDGTYTITSTPVENEGKATSVTVTISNIVAPGYDLATSTSALLDGAKVLVYCYDNQKVMSTTKTGSLRTGLSLSVAQEDVAFISANKLPANTEIMTLIKNEAYWELKTSGDKYLGLALNSNQVDVYDAPEADNTEWTISFTGNNATIQSVAFTNRDLECNNSTGNFGCYAGTQKKVQLYVLRNTDPYFTISDSNVYIGPRGTHTLTLTAHNGASDTVTWSTSDATKVSIPASSTGMSVVVTGEAVGSATITATFADSVKYKALSCVVEVLDLQPYVNVGVTTFTKTTSKPSGGWAGTYLIGDATSKNILDGSLSPLPAGGENYATLDSLPNTVSATSELIAKSFTIAATEQAGQYTIRSNSYYYIGNTTASNNMSVSISKAYVVNISDAGVITANSTTLAFNSGSNSSFRFFQNATDAIRAVGLWKANGEVREITSTLASWYDEVKAEEYLSCQASGEGSKINWEKLEESAIEMLTVADLDTLEKMTAKSAENGGNYLEDLMSDYDFLVAYKHYDNFLNRELMQLGGVVIFGNNSFSETNIVMAIVIIVSMVGVAFIGSYLLIKRRKER